MVLKAVLGILLLCNAACAVKFTISPSTFVPGVTPLVTMRCEVADSGPNMIQLLLVQISIEDRGTTIPIVTLTPGQPPKVMRTDLEDQITVDGKENQFQNISSSYLSVMYSFPNLEVASNYSCTVSGLSIEGLLARFSVSTNLVAGAVEELPHFMTESLVQLRATIESLKSQAAMLVNRANNLRVLSQNLTQELELVDQEYRSLANEFVNLRSSAVAVTALLNKPSDVIEDLSYLRPKQKVAFHAAMSTLGATSAVMNFPLIFDYVITNEGHGYDSSTGIFSAPVDGTYLLTASIESGSGMRPSEVSIKVDGSIVQTMQIADDTDYEHSSVTTIVALTAGQEVTCEFTWISQNPGYVGSSSLAAPYISTFSGYVLW